MANDRLYISVIGAGVGDARAQELASEVGRRIAGAGAVLVCGGMGGVMEAACRGARQAGGSTLGILPGLDRGEGNPYLDFTVLTGIGHARNLAVASSGDAVIAVGGEFGTLSEIGLARQAGRPVILLDSWQLRRHGALPTGVSEAASPGEAVEQAIRLAAAGRS
ncbi:MAG TPA: TIGR00725 family protein [Actinobacteria bacterium]|nr:TIGR00725 family protein [Actinomycetota bacterium]